MLVSAIACVALLAGCSSARPWINQPLAADGPEPVAAMADADPEDLSMIVAVTLSGGGARAAAFGYGVLDALRQTQVRWRGRDTSLLDEIDVISGVSGGSIVATYYAAFGRDAFPAFEREFLKQDFQDTLVSHMLKPASLYELSSPWIGRTHLLERRLAGLYRGLTYGDLAKRPHQPRLLVSATDLSLGSGFEFSGEQFALICSDLGSVPLSFAVAASSAVPVVLSPLTLRNYNADCPRPGTPARDAAEADTPGADYRLRLLRSTQRSYLDATTRPYIHLVDGGLADNLGVRGLLDRALEGGVRGPVGDLPPGTVRRAVIIAVNAERDPSERIDASDKVPNIAQVADALLFGAGARATNETLGLLADTARSWQREMQRRQAGGRDVFAPDAQLHVVTVNLRDAPELLRPQLLLQVPTAFSIPRDDVDALMEAGRQILRRSPQFQQLLQSLGGELPPAP